MARGAVHSRCGRDPAEHRRQWCDSPAHSRCPKGLACDRQAPTTGRPANAQDQPPAYADNCAREHARPPAGEEMRGWHREARQESGHCATKLLRPVEILQNQIQQLGALNDAGFDESPFVGRNQERNDIDLPGPICPERIAVDVVRDSVLANAALGAAPAPSQFLGADRPQATPSGVPSAAGESRHQPTTRHRRLRSGAEFDKDRLSWDKPRRLRCGSFVRAPAAAGPESSERSGWSLPPAPPSAGEAHGRLLKAFLTAVFGFRCVDWPGCV